MTTRVIESALMERCVIPASPAVILHGVDARRREPLPSRPNPSISSKGDLHV